MIGLPAFVLPKGAKGCIMQWAAIIAGQARWSRSADPWLDVTDQPQCTNAVVTTAATWVNDRSVNVRRQRLWPLLPRLNAALRTSAQADEGVLHEIEQQLCLADSLWAGS